MIPDQQVTINSRKYDLSLSRSWNCTLIERSEPLLVFVGEFDQQVTHDDLGTISKGTISYEYYWLDRWYNIFRFHEPDGSFRNWYCNVNMPPVFRDGILDYVDLDIDILVWADWQTEVLDRDEFESNAVRFDYPTEIRAQAESAVGELLAMIKGRIFPFDFDASATFADKAR